MDLLKGELQRKRKAAADDFGGKGFVRRSELERKHLQKLRDEHRAAKARAPARSPEPAAVSGRIIRPGAAAGNPNPITSSSSSAAATAASSVVPAALDLPRHEVVRRLRVLREPVTLFGEDDAARAERFVLVLKSGVFDDDNDIDGLDVAEGQTNEFLRDMIRTRKRRRGGTRVGGGAVEDNADKDATRMNANFEELCEEDKILVFFKRQLNEWEQMLDGVTELEMRTTDWNGGTVAEVKQRAQELDPLFELCRKKVLPDAIRRALLLIVECCMKGDYLAASEEYIRLCVGNKAWPMGVTMVGIHERSAREKICANGVAHIMNDETTRRYLQSIKRLVTACQPHHPV